MRNTTGVKLHREQREVNKIFGKGDGVRRIKRSKEVL